MGIASKSGANFTRLFDLLNYQVTKYPNSTAFNFFKDGVLHSISITQFQERADALSVWFIENGFQKGEKIIIAPLIGSPDWMIIDFACQQIGLITVPIHPNLHDEEIQVILTETEAKLCITTGQGFSQLQKIANKLNSGTLIFQIESGSRNFFNPLLFVHSSPDKELKEIKSSISPNDIVTILYTSGSSGEPKGVMLSHHNIVCNIKSVLTFFPLEPKHRVLSFLPFSHIFERAITYGYIAFGVSIFFSESRESFSRDFSLVRPHFCTSVPRVLEKMYDYLQQQMLSKNALKRLTINWAIEVGKQYKERERIGFIYGAQLLLARLLVLGRWRKKLGGKIRYMVVGAASLRPEIGRLLSAAGVQVVEGYGLTETAPLISINRFEPGMTRFGTVGLVVPGVQVRIEQIGDEDEGEILVKGQNVMLGYFKKPDFTRDAFTEDGWFRTGDVGKFVHHRFLQITDRKKDIFKTSSGKYIAPLPLQNHFGESAFIQRCLIIGFQRPFVIALVVPNFQLLETWCKKESIHWTSPEFMIHNIKVLVKFKQEIDHLNKGLPNFKQVKGFVLCPKEWSAEAGEVTATLKPVRKVLEKNYGGEIDKIYDRLMGTV